MKLVQVQESQVGLFLGESTVQVQDSIKLETLLLAIARPSALTEAERDAVVTFQANLKEGKQIQLEESEYETFEKLNMLEGYLGEGAVSQWFAFFFKGTSQEAVEKIENDVKNNIKSKEDYEKTKLAISQARKKVEERGDFSHTVGNLFFPLGLGGLIIKHLIKVYAYKDEREKAIHALNLYSQKLEDLARDKKWR